MVIIYEHLKHDSINAYDVDKMKSLPNDSGPVANSFPNKFAWVMELILRIKCCTPSMGKSKIEMESILPTKSCTL
jgi:hypothetical protein